jgi:hypothetical protein
LQPTPTSNLLYRTAISTLSNPARCFWWALVYALKDLQ